MAQKRLQFIPAATINAVNNATPYAFTEPITGLPIPGSGLVLGDYCDLSLAEAASYSTTALPLYEGRYQFVLVDSGATAANVKRGTIAMWTTVAKTDFCVTSYDKALAASLTIGVFLNAITPGNYGFIQVAGRATVLPGTLTATGAVGDPVIATTAGVVDVPSGNVLTFALLGQYIGKALQVLTSATAGQMKIEIPFGSY